MSEGSSAADADEEKRWTTRLEAVVSPAVIAAQLAAQSAGGGAPADDTVPFRPVHRPPIGVLVVADDGSADGEVIRFRQDSYVIGRTDGDVRIPHDGMMSARHARLSRETDRGRARWFLTDLESRNGTFVRVNAAALQHGSVVLFGSRRYRFRDAPPPAADPGGDGAATVGFRAVNPTDLFPSVVEVRPDGSEGPPFLLQEDAVTVGRDPKRCALVLDDPMVSPVHARLSRDAKGVWQVENQGALNGTWVKITRVPVGRGVQFLLGEQRFHFRVGG